MVHDYSFFGSTADFVIKKGTFGIFTGFGHLQTSETSGRNMTASSKNWMGKNEDLTDFKGGNGKFCRYKCFQCWCKGEKHENKQKYNC